MYVVGVIVHLLELSVFRLLVAPDFIPSQSMKICLNLYINHGR